MQYFATTISSTDNSTKQPSTPPDIDEHKDIIWVPRCDIREESTILGESSRSVVGSITTNNGSCDQQLQCIISKSNATLSYVFYTEQTQEEMSDTNIVIPVETNEEIYLKIRDICLYLAVCQTFDERIESNW